MRIVYFGGCWDTNIGNAFIDYGMMHTLRKYNTMMFSEKSPFLFGKNRSNYFCSVLDFAPDVVVFGGMMLCPSFFKDQKWILDILEENKIPVLINGGGGANYGKTEIINTRNCISKYSCLKGLITRDSTAYNLYKDLFNFTHDGIDVAFFIPEIDKFSFLSSIDKIYKVVNKDNDFGFNKKYINGYDGKLIYAHHEPNMTRINNRNIDFNNERILISEIPEEYIYMYGKTKYLYSSRIHACVITLAFGGQSHLYSSTPRKKLFERVGCGELDKKMVFLDINYLSSLKEEHQQKIGEFINELC